MYFITDKLISGSVPEGEEGFQSLKELGVQTVISVDGARPEVERARRIGLRYVHLPFGYDGIPRDQGLRIARAVRDLPGKVYLHCHHGKHRGPAAAAVAHLCLDDRCSVADAIAEMKRAGTDPHYTGLYDAPAQIGKVAPADLDRVSADFPEVAPVTALAQVMVDVDQRFDRLKAVKAAGWKTPPSMPDVVPAHEALQLAEQYQEAARLPALAERPAELRTGLTEAAEQVRALEQALRQGPDATAATKALEAVGQSCARCHAKYRDVPRPPASGGR